MAYAPIHFQQTPDQFSDHWAPNVIAELNHRQLKLVKMEGAFLWHARQDTDEVFIVLQGKMEIAFLDAHLLLREGELFMVPQAGEHKPVAAEEYHGRSRGS